MAELQQRMSSREFAQWWAFHRREPIGDRRADLRTAMLAALLAEQGRDPKKRREPFTPDDFDVMPQFEERDALPDIELPAQVTPDVEMLLRIRERMAGGTPDDG